MTRVKEVFGAHRWGFMAGLGGVLLVAAAFIVGMVVSDESSKVSDLEERVAIVEGELVDEEKEVGYAEEEKERADENAEDAEEQLAVERSFKGSGAKQEPEGEYETDYPVNAAGKVGPFIFKPTEISDDGEGKWVLTVEAKNESSSPLEPFCGGGESILLDAEENEYSGEALLFKGGANCSEALQPGLTAKYLAEFHLRPTATPVAAYIYGEFELEEEGKTWELAH